MTDLQSSLGKLDVGSEEEKISKLDETRKRKRCFGFTCQLCFHISEIILL